jgi:hypothetical protein
MSGDLSEITNRLTNRLLVVINHLTALELKAALLHLFRGKLASSMRQQQSKLAMALLTTLACGVKSCPGIVDFNALYSGTSLPAHASYMQVPGTSPHGVTQQPILPQSAQICMPATAGPAAPGSRMMRQLASLGMRTGQMQTGWR